MRRLGGFCYTLQQWDCDAHSLAALAYYAWLVNTNVVRAVRRRGNVNDGANDGPRYMNANDAVSNGNWNYGGELYLHQSQHDADATPMLDYPNNQTVYYCASFSIVPLELKCVRLERLSKSLKSREDEKTMKRFDHLWESFCSIGNAEAAIIQGTVNKRSDNVVQRKLCVDTDIPALMSTLDPDKVKKYAQRTLSILESGWVHGQLKKKLVIPARGKRRDIDCPNLQDHIIHWMLILAIKKALTRGMYKHTYGSIPGRGIEGARRTTERWVQHDDRCKYFVKLDIRKFYPNIDQERLKGMFRRVIKDERILTVIDQVIGCIPKGLPIGTYTSQWFGNFYLQGLDHHIVQDMYKLRRGKRIPYVSRYLRNMDDMQLFGNSRRDLEKAVREIIRYCHDELGLEIKPDWEIRKVASFERKPDGRRVLTKGAAPVDIVGYRFYRQHTEVRGGTYIHTQHLVAKAEKSLRKRGSILLLHAQGINSLAGWFDHADSENYLKELNQTISIKFIRRVISYAAKHGIVGDAARIYCGTGERDGDYHILYGCSGGRTRRRHCVSGRGLEYALSVAGQPAGAG